MSVFTDSELPSPLYAFAGTGWQQYGTHTTTLGYDWFTPSDPALTAALPWWLAGKLDDTAANPCTARDWASSGNPAVHIATAATAGSVARIIGKTPLRLSNFTAVHLSVDLPQIGTGAREITVALDNYETDAGVLVPGADRGLRLTYSTADGYGKVAWNNVAAGSEQIQRLHMIPVGVITLGIFPATGHVGIWAGDQCIFLRRPTDLNVASSAQLVRPRVQVKALGAAVAAVQVMGIRLSATWAPYVIGVLPPTEPEPVAAPTAMTLTATPGDGQVTIARTGGVGEGVTYALYRGTTATGTPIATTFPFADTGRTNGTPVSYVATATNGAGTVTSNVVTATPTATEEPPVDPPPAGAAFLSDTFTGPDQALHLHTAGETGHTWAKHPHSSFSGGTGAVLANRLVGATTGGTGYLASITPPSDDYEVEAEFHFAAVPTNQNIGFGARWDPTIHTGYILRYITSVGGFRLDRIVNNATTNLAAYPITVTPGSTHTAALRLDGSTLTVTVDGVAQAPITDTTITAAGRVGVIMNAVSTATTGAHIDALAARAI